ncbi:sirohydrochlorin chelatase [Streptomyces sp. NPDC056463]|uniref:sirohydrochlorin chelatase n=1 Tax=Streptomyces sp. NPDC056463 TaxID=3345827 RepID=UPI00368A93DD
MPVGRMLAPHGPYARPAVRAAGPDGTALVLVAHGSRDPRHSATLRGLADGVRSLAGLRTRIAFLEFDRPGVADALGAAVAAGADRVVVVPLLLSRAYHATTDLPAALAGDWGVPVHTTDVLGGSPLLVTALERRLLEAGSGPSGRDSSGVVVAATGSRDAGARASVAAVARALRRAGRRDVLPAYVTGPGRRPGDAVRELRARGVRRVAVAPYVLAPGLLPDRIAAEAADAGADVLAAPLGAAPELVRLVVERGAGAVAG